MFYAEIVVKDDYQKKGDLVYRPLLRAYQEAGLRPLMHNGDALLIGLMDKDFVFHEWFTGKTIEYSGAKDIDMGYMYEIIRKFMDRPDKIEEVKRIINQVIFKEKQDDKGIVYENIPSGKIDDASEQKRMYEEEEDRQVELRAYENGLSMIDPYDKNNLMGYNDFLYKCQKLNEMQERKSK